MALLHLRGKIQLGGGVSESFISALKKNKIKNKMKFQTKIS